MTCKKKEKQKPVFWFRGRKRSHQVSCLESWCLHLGTAQAQLCVSPGPQTRRGRMPLVTVSFVWWLFAGELLFPGGEEVTSERSVKVGGFRSGWKVACQPDLVYTGTHWPRTSRAHGILVWPKARWSVSLSWAGPSHLWTCGHYSQWFSLELTAHVPHVESLWELMGRIFSFWRRELHRIQRYFKWWNFTYKAWQKIWPNR